MVEVGEMLGETLNVGLREGVAEILGEGVMVWVLVEVVLIVEVLL